MGKRRGQKAWLVTWEWDGPHAAVEDRVAAILRPRLSQRVVGEIVETLYAVHAYHPTELAWWSKQPGKNPYKAWWDNGYWWCGHNPSLCAVKVHSLVVDKDPNTGLETIRWVEPPLYRLNRDTGNVEQVRGDRPDFVTRTITGPLSDREIGRYTPEWVK